MAIFKFLGHLGAIEPYFINKLEKRRYLEGTQNPEEVRKVLFQLLRRNMSFFEELPLMGSKAEGSEMAKFKTFKRNIRIIENHQKNIDLEEDFYLEDDPK